MNIVKTQGCASEHQMKFVYDYKTNTLQYGYFSDDKQTFYVVSEQQIEPYYWHTDPVDCKNFMLHFVGRAPIS